MGRLVLVLLGVLTVAAFASSRAADPPSLKGTWVRETMVGPTMGNQVILTFTDHRVTARLRSGGRDPGGHEGWVTIEFEGEYARTDSGLLVGTITGMNVDLSKIPDGDSPGELLGKSVSKMIGEPFCFRARVSDGALTVTDLKVPDVKIDDEHSSREMIAGFASGKYVSSPTENVPVPKLKAAKAIPFNHTRLAGNITTFMWLMSRPGAILSNPPEPPMPENVSQLPSLPLSEPGPLPGVMPSPMPPPHSIPMPSPVTMTPQPMPMPWAMPAPVTFSSRPMPMPIPMSSAMPPAPFAMAPQPVPMVIVPAKACPTQTSPAVRAESLMYQGFESWQPEALPALTLSDVDGSITEVPNPSRETVLREIDLGEAGTMQVIVRMKRDKAKPMLPPVASTIIPTAGQLLPPGSMRNMPVIPAVADAWKNAERIDGGIMK